MVKHKNGAIIGRSLMIKIPAGRGVLFTFLNRCLKFILYIIVLGFQFLFWFDAADHFL